MAVLSPLERRELQRRQAQVSSARKQLSLEEQRIKGISIPKIPFRRFGMSIADVKKEQVRIKKLGQQKASALEQIRKQKSQVGRFESRTVGVIKEIARKRAEEKGKERERKILFPKIKLKSVKLPEILKAALAIERLPEALAAPLRTKKSSELLKKVLKEEGLSAQQFISTEFTGESIKGIPISKVIITNVFGRKIRDANKEERRIFRAQNKVVVPFQPEFDTKTERELFRLGQKADSLIQKKQRQGGVLSVKDETKLAQIEANRFILSTKKFVKDAPKIVVGIPIAIKNIIKKPSKLLEIPKELKIQGVESGKLLRIDPTTAILRIGEFYLVTKITTKGLKLIGRLSSKLGTRLNPKFKKVKGRSIIIPSGQTTKKTITIKVVKKIPKETIRAQAKLAGERVTAISAQADKLIKFIRKSKLIRKPIPKEELLSKTTKKLLKQFDAGTISKKNLIKLDRLIRLETKGAGQLLERTLFADPRRRLRISRLGLKGNKEASLLDILAGDVTFKAQKPQILIFEKIKVQRFPKTKIFIKIKKKLLKAKKIGVKPTFTSEEAKALLKFQITPSGKFKPLGKLSFESEIIISPSEIIKKVKTLAVTFIKGKRVPIISVKIVKAKKSTLRLLKKARLGKLTRKELKQLKKLLKKETGFTPSFSRSIKRRPIVRARRIIPKISRVLKRRKKVKRRVVKRRIVRRKPIKRKVKRRVVRKRVIKRKPIVRKVVRRKVVRKVIKRKIVGRPKRIRRVIKPIIPVGVLIPKVKKRPKKKPKKKRIQAFDVYARPLKRKGAKKKPKLIKVNINPLTKKRAKDLRDFILDTSLARTGKIRPSRKVKPKKTKLRGIPVGYSKRVMKKFRRFRQVKGMKKRLPRGKVIEKSRHLLDTRQEKRKIGLKRRIAQLQPRRKLKPKKRIVKRKFTATQRKVMLKNLAKARRIRFKKLKTTSRTSIPKRKTARPQKTIRFTRNTKTTRKRTLSAKQLSNLAKGRAIRMANLKKRKG